MPPVAIVYSLGFSGDRETEDEPSDEITSDLSPYLRDIMETNGVRVASPEALNACCSPCGRLIKWGVIATMEIGAQKVQVRNFGEHSVTGWRFRGDLSAIRQKLDADFLLLTVFKQARETSGRKVGNFFAGGYTIGKQIDVACITDLRDGQMVWCAAMKDDSNDLGEQGRARTVMAKLLREMFRIPARP